MLDTIKYISYFRSHDRVFLDDDRESWVTEQSTVHLNDAVLVDDHMVEYDALRDLNVLEEYAVRHASPAPYDATAKQNTVLHMSHDRAAVGCEHIFNDTASRSDDTRRSIFRLRVNWTINVEELMTNLGVENFHGRVEVACHAVYAQQRLFKLNGLNTESLVVLQDAQNREIGNTARHHLRQKLQQQIARNDDQTDGIILTCRSRIIDHQIAYIAIVIKLERHRQRPVNRPVLMVQNGDIGTRFNVRFDQRLVRRIRHKSTAGNDDVSLITRFNVVDHALRVCPIGLARDRMM